jgi:tetratricopeptide (TPR) repeat protein
VYTYFNRAILWHKLNSYKKAIDDYTTAINLNPIFATAYYNRSVVRTVIKDYKGAKNDYDMAVKLNTSLNDSSRLSLIDSTGLAKLIQFKANFEEGNVQVAQDRETGIFPMGNYSITYMLADSLRKHNRLPNEKTLVISGESNIKDTFLITSNTYSLTHDTAEKIINSLKQYNASRKHTSKLFIRAAVEEHIQLFNNALDDYDTLAWINPKSVYAYFNRANARYEMIAFVNSMNDYNSQFLSIGDEKQKKKQPVTLSEYSDVISDYTRCIQVDSTFSYAYYNFANLKIELKDFTGALSLYNKAITNQPKFAAAYYNRGLTYIYIKEKEKGCTDLSRAGELGLKSAYSIIKRFCDE